MVGLCKTLLYFKVNTFLLKTIFSIIIVLVNVTSYALQTILSVAYELERYLIALKNKPYESISRTDLPLPRGHLDQKQTTFPLFKALDYARTRTLKQKEGEKRGKHPQ